MTIRNLKDLAIAKKILAAYPHRNINANTRNRYMQTGAKFFRDHVGALNTHSKKTYYLRKAALTFYAIHMLDLAIVNDDEQLFHDALVTLKKFHTEDQPGDAIAQGKRCPIQDAKRTHGKRQSLSFLPDDWMEVMLKGVSGHHRLWLLLFSVGGVRPQEIVNGITVTPHHDGVILKVLGAKSAGKYGQPVREFYVKSWFAAELSLLGPQTISAGNASTVSSYVSKRGKKLFGDHIDSASAYSYRHQFSANLKASDLSADEVSALLGHSVDDTKKHYGVRGQSRGTMKVKLLHASRPVKKVKKPRVFPLKTLTP